jgi:hypothetical protein
VRRDIQAASIIISAAAENKKPTVAGLSVTVTLTSPLMRETAAAGVDPPDVLDHDR